MKDTLRGKRKETRITRTFSKSEDERGRDRAISSQRPTITFVVLQGTGSICQGSHAHPALSVHLEIDDEDAAKSP
jgi:hypothetical protein